jgi:hypothetical protein
MSNENTLALSSTVWRSPSQMSGCIDARAILLSVENGKYYSMNAMGTRIWELIQSPTRIDTLIRDLLEHFDVDAAMCEAEVLQFLARLRLEHLVEVQAERH